MDWNKLRKEYITGNLGCRKLAEKRGVSYHTLRKVASKEKWKALRDEYRAKSDAKIIDATSDAAAENANKVFEVANKLLDKLSQTIDELPALDSQTIKHFTSALKDLRDIKGVKSDADMREQEARIANLRKQAEKDNVLDDRAYGVVLMPCVAEALTPPEEEESNEE